jgi:hypothetical protein
MQFIRFPEFMLKVWGGEVDFRVDRFDIALINDPANSGFSDISLQTATATLAGFTGGMSGGTGFSSAGGGHEFDGSAYVRGTLAGQTRTLVANQILFDGTDQTFAALSNDGILAAGIGGILGILYVDGTEANDVPAFILPFEKTPSGADVVCKWPATGLLYERQGA